MEEPAMMWPVVVPRGNDSTAVWAKVIPPEAVENELESKPKIPLSCKFSCHTSQNCGWGLKIQKYDQISKWRWPPDPQAWRATKAVKRELRTISDFFQKINLLAKLHIIPLNFNRCHNGCMKGLEVKGILPLLAESWRVSTADGVREGGPKLQRSLRLARRDRNGPSKQLQHKGKISENISPWSVHRELTGICCQMWTLRGICVPAAQKTVTSI